MNIVSILDEDSGDSEMPIVAHDVCILRVSILDEDSGDSEEALVYVANRSLARFNPR